MKNIYKKAGIANIKEFYLNKFHTEQYCNYFQLGQKFRHNINFAKYHWIAANVYSDSKVLDLGCGCGNLLYLKALNCEVFGIDLSLLNCQQAHQNGYDGVVCGDVCALPFDDSFFDVVVSLDLLGHIEFEQKDVFIKEVCRVLKKEGLTLHGIESDLLDYDTFTEAELAAFVSIDGHVGMEGQQENEERFKKYFEYVESQFQFNLCLPIEEIWKQQQMYPQKFQADPYLLNRISKFDGKEQDAWNLAMNFVFERVMRLKPKVPDQWGFLFLRAGHIKLPDENFGNIDLSRFLKPIFFGSSEDSYHAKAGFWHPEFDHGQGLSFRWTTQEAEIWVPPAKIYQLAIGTSRPGHADSVVCSFFINDHFILECYNN